MEDECMVKGQEGESDGDLTRLFTVSRMGILKSWSLADGSGLPRSVHTPLLSVELRPWGSRGWLRTAFGLNTIPSDTKYTAKWTMLFGSSITGSSTNTEVASRGTWPHGTKERGSANPASECGVQEQTGTDWLDDPDTDNSGTELLQTS